jgi:hypothetical protein
MKLGFKQLLKILGILIGGVGNIPKDAFSQMEKDKDLL